MKVFYNYDMNRLLQWIGQCESKHVQQVAFSTYHKSLTQICFGYEIVRTMLDEDEVN